MIRNSHATTYYPQLDGWRGYAILWIMLGHVAFIHSIDYTENFFLLFLDTSNFLAVDIFFVISGYMITEKLLAAEGQIRWQDFIKKRSLKILPLYFFIVLLVLVVDGLVPNYGFEVDKIIPGRTMKGGEMCRALISRRGDTLPSIEEYGSVSIKNRGESIWQDFLLIQNFYPFQDRVKLLAHTWFVAVIVHFYILYGLLFAIVARFFSSREKRRNILLGVLAILMLTIGLLRYAAGTQYHDYFQMTHFRLDVIFLGCVLSLLKDYTAGMQDRIFSNPVFLSLLFCAGFAILAAVIFRWPPIDKDQSPNVFIVSYFAFGLMITATMAENPFSRIIFRNPVITWIGRYSYGMYLWHYPFMFFYRMLAIKMQWSNTFSIFTFCILSIIFGAGLQRFFERAPGLTERLIARFSR
jgi:peptidoglycan/LPS O-acetylase OafA/YrhL